MSNLVPVTEMNWTPEQTKLITDVVAKGATPDELKLFLYRCKNMGLDPLKPGVIHFVKYNNGPGTIIVGIEGFRSIAARTGKMAGIKRGVTFDASGNLKSAWCEVYRTDWKEPAREEVPVAEYNTGKGPWAKMPQTMLKKVAECAALRMAFPDDLGGVYERAEMDQAEPNPSESHEEPKAIQTQPVAAQETNAAKPAIIIKPLGSTSENGQKRELSIQIFTAGNKLGMNVQKVGEWVEDNCGSSLKDLTVEEMKHVLAEFNRLYEGK